MTIKTPNEHVITFARDGIARCLWTEAVPLHELGHLALERAGTIEFNEGSQQWGVRLTCNPDVVAFSHSSRETCLSWERDQLSNLL